MDSFVGAFVDVNAFCVFFSIVMQPNPSSTARFSQVVTSDKQYRVPNILFLKYFQHLLDKLYRCQTVSP